MSTVLVHFDKNQAKRMQFHYHVASQINLSITRQHIFKAMNAFTDICGLKKTKHLVWAELEQV